MKKTVRFHRGDSPFKMVSPLKNDGDETKNGSSSSESKTIPARSGDVKGTYKTTTERVKTNEVALNTPKARPMMGNEAWKKYLATETSDQKKKRLAREAKEAAEDKAKMALRKQASEITNTKGEFVADKTPKVEGTTSDTFTAEERRIQNRGEKINMRQERQLGRQGLRRDKRFMKQSADWQKMTPEERKAAMNELKHGKASDDTTPSQLDRFGKGFKDRVNKEREMKHGQGEMNKALIDQEIKNPGDARATRMEQYTQGKGWINSTETQNKADILKADAGGKEVKVTEEEKKTLPDVARGETKTSSTSSSSSSKTNAEKSGEKARSYFQEALKKFDSNKTITSSPGDNKEQSDPTSRANAVKATTPEKDAISQARSISRENSKWGKEDDSPLNMTKKASGFSMKGFGSKIGFNFNNKK